MSGAGLAPPGTTADATTADGVPGHGPAPHGLTPRRPPARARLAGTPRHALARLAYVVVVCLATLRGLDLDPSLAHAVARLQRGVAPSLRAGDVLDAVRNVALFAGFGATWIATALPTRLGRRIAHATLLGVALSAAVEAVQLFSPVRWASVADLFTNGLGAFAGAAGTAVVLRATAAARRRPSILPPPMLALAVPYVSACWLEAFSPRDGMDRVPGAWGGPAHRFEAAVAWLRTQPAAPPTWTEVLLFAPAGVLGLLALLERRWRPWPAAAAVAVAALPALATAEALRGLTGADMRPWAALARLAAVTAAALATAAWVSRRQGLAPFGTLPPEAAAGRDRRALLVAALVAACWSLRPFVPVGSRDALARNLADGSWAPLAAQYSHWSLHGVPDVAVGFLLYAPLGAWLAARSAARASARPLAPGASPWRGLWPGLALAAVTELAQYLVVGRTFDVTDILVQAAGVLVGWSLLRRADARAAIAVR